MIQFQVLKFSQLYAPPAIPTYIETISNPCPVCYQDFSINNGYKVMCWHGSQSLDKWVCSDKCANMYIFMNYGNNNWDN